MSAKAISHWIVITRAPFLSATVLPLLIAACWYQFAYAPAQFPLLYFILAVIAAAALHVSANTYNDYFDWQSGTDPQNKTYIAPFTGGSRAVEKGLIDQPGMFRVATIALLLGALTATPIIIERGAGIVLFGLAGAALAFFYTAPPVRLCARRGAGEFSIFLAFGPLLIAGAIYTLAGDVQWRDLLAGIYIGILTMGILVINEIPDKPSDAATGKNNLVVTLGRRNAVLMLAGLFLLAQLLVLHTGLTGLMPRTVLLLLLLSPWMLSVIRAGLNRDLNTDFAEVCASMIRLHTVAGLVFCASLLGAVLLRNV